MVFAVGSIVEVTFVEDKDLVVFTIEVVFVVGSGVVDATESE